MKRMLRLMLVAATTMAAIAPAIAQTVGSGPYYATPSWDQQLQCDSTATCPRFIVLSNWHDANFPAGGAAVLDRETGLVWERSPSNSGFSWSDAQIHCMHLAVGNRQGWRVPTIQELKSLVDTTQGEFPTLPAGHPFNNLNVINWSATTVVTDASLAWIAVLNGFHDEVPVSKIDPFEVWCVRGGQGMDSQ